ncbi:glycosyltransferase family 2 protein [bacterium]|nr:glycosyltransferase family 2 protein [bacterium]
MKISVIIPVYNVEKTLSQTLDSVINQTYKDLEIICVNDASTDSSLEILKSYAQQDSRIKIVENEVNSKLGPTRNHGMEFATGEYIHFLDSDDWMESDAYERLVKYLEKAGKNVDVIHFLWTFVCPNKHEKFECNYNNPDLTEKVINIIDEPELAYNWLRSAWNKLYRRQFLLDNNIVFNAYPCMEDIEHNISVLTKADSIYLIKDRLLNYRINNPKSLVGRSYQFYDCALKSYYTNCETCKILPADTKENILELELFNLLKILYGSFARNVLSSREVRNIINNLDMTVFRKDYSNYKWYVYYNDIMKNPVIIAKMKYYLRQFVRDNFYGVFLVIKDLRKESRKV